MFVEDGAICIYGVPLTAGEKSDLRRNGSGYIVSLNGRMHMHMKTKCIKCFP